MKFFNKILKFFTLGKINFFVSLCLCVSLSSCFTGIESTKKINLSREDKKNLAPTKEELFMAQIESQPLKDWQDGKRFIVTDDRALLVIVPEAGIISTPPDSIKGATLEFAGVESKINAAGIIDLALRFSDGIYLYSYNTGKEFQKALEEVSSDQIPMLIDEDMVTQARSLLSGQKLWSRSNLWYDENDNPVDGKKYIQVEVLDVLPGNMVFPLKLKIKADDGRIAFVFMNFGSNDNESRSFHNLFSFNDIRKHYPSIDSETWNFISQGKVREGMTKDEVRLAWGNPSDVASGHDYSQTLDIWSYENGKALWFEDGRLVKIRQ